MCAIEALSQSGPSFVVTHVVPSWHFIIIHLLLLEQMKSSRSCEGLRQDFGSRVGKRRRWMQKQKL